MMTREAWAEERCLRTLEANNDRLKVLDVVTRLWLDVDMVTECWYGSRRSAFDMTEVIGEESREGETRLIPGSEI
jgi:hypothetical protein